MQKDQTLESVDEKLIKTEKFLEDVSSDSRMLDCLTCFAQCQEVIMWLRDMTKGTQVEKLSVQFVMCLSWHMVVHHM